MHAMVLNQPPAAARTGFRAGAWTVPPDRFEDVRLHGDSSNSAHGQPRRDERVQPA